MIEDRQKHRSRRNRFFSSKKFGKFWSAYCILSKCKLFSLSDRTLFKMTLDRKNAKIFTAYLCMLYALAWKLKHSKQRVAFQKFWVQQSPMCDLNWSHSSLKAELWVVTPKMLLILDGVPTSIHSLSNQPKPVTIEESQFAQQKIHVEKQIVSFRVFLWFAR